MAKSKSVTQSKYAAERTIREITKDMDHCPVAEIVQIIRERHNIAADPEFIAAILRGEA